MKKKFSALTLRYRGEADEKKWIAVLFMLVFVMTECYEMTQRVSDIGYFVQVIEPILLFLQYAKVFFVWMLCAVSFTIRTYRNQNICYQLIRSGHEQWFCTECLTLFLNVFIFLGLTVMIGIFVSLMTGGVSFANTWSPAARLFYHGGSSFIRFSFDESYCKEMMYCLSPWAAILIQCGLWFLLIVFLCLLDEFLYFIGKRAVGYLAVVLCCVAEIIFQSYPVMNRILSYISPFYLARLCRLNFGLNEYAPPLQYAVSYFVVLNLILLLACKYVSKKFMFTRDWSV